MLSQAKLVLDFDGTLVIENSSRVLAAVLTELRPTLVNRMFVSLQSGRLRLPGVVVFAGLGRLAGGRDGGLMLLLLLNRRYLRTQAATVWQQVAARLTLNPGLKPEYSQPFDVLSTGLEPILLTFMAIHPELACPRLVGSKVEVGSSLKLELLRPRDKVELLNDYAQARYFTDYDHEAAVIVRALPGRAQASVYKCDSPNQLHLVEIQS